MDQCLDQIYERSIFLLGYRIFFLARGTEISGISKSQIFTGSLLLCVVVIDSHGLKSMVLLLLVVQVVDEVNKA